MFILLLVFTPERCRLACQDLCPCNLKKNANRKSQAELQSYHAGMPLERVHIDIVGPLVESHRGNKLILVLVDQFTKWFEFYAVPGQTAEVVCKELVNQFITRFGLPQQITQIRREIERN